MRSRRQFLIGSGQAIGQTIAALAFASGVTSRLARGAEDQGHREHREPHSTADTPGKHPGIQLYTINDAMRTDARAALQQLRKIGYVEVESAGYGSLSAQQFRGLLDEAGLTCPSAHLQFDAAHVDAAFADAHALGAKFAVSSIMRPLVLGTNTPKNILSTGMSLDEAKRTAELANRLGEAAQRAGLQFTYHNHNHEFAVVGAGQTGYDVILKETDPKLVQFEIDCGWMIFAGHDPVAYFKQHPRRFPMIHVKDFLPREKGATDMQGAELGHGTVDYKPIFAAAVKAGLQHYFVEQEGPFARMSTIEAARVDFEYLRSIGKA